jgi:hypothetical protein
MKTFKYTIPTGKELDEYLARPHPLLWVFLGILAIERLYTHFVANEAWLVAIEALFIALCGVFVYREMKKANEIKRGLKAR